MKKVYCWGAKETWKRGRGKERTGTLKNRKREKGRGWTGIDSHLAGGIASCCYITVGQSLEEFLRGRGMHGVTGMPPEMTIQT